ncbi:uncharacterized protein LOC120141293 [Hibiscus syriacus]|uniref:uncharacterized protein LOC120141293 n=1 Tax=Hibiscus syriacus TaxID=106335 RepID=UPI0019245D4C|nr:uncharacterized protein LOC120141293 [Hibiscus syriacus]
MLKLQSGHAPGLEPECVISIQSGCEKTGEADNVLCSDKIRNTIEDELPDGFSPSEKSSCISDDESSPVRTMESGIKPCNSNLADSYQFSGTDGRSKVAETLSELAEVDNLIQIAAESLMHFTSKNSACYQESSNQTASKEWPQCSYDSFELMTLELAESIADDYSLRRGRRLKDFQDILLGLASPFRHEIREDINILEGVLRSREYKKMRAKMANGESWCKPVRSRRSRLNYVAGKTSR